MESEQCSFPRCKNLHYLTYVRRPICVSHWQQLCQADNQAEKGLLKKIGLVRDEDGDVILIK